jgi:glycosyltransferase involved in cell wall biosynthesis
MSVLIVSYRRPQLLQNCLRSLGRQTRLPDEVIVVGVDGDEATATVVQQFAMTSAFPCTWQSVPVPSVVRQTNLGLETCKSDVVAFTNDDAEPFPDWLERMESYYEDEITGGVGGRDFIHLEDGQVWEGQADRIGKVTWLGRVYGNHHLSHTQVVDVDLLKGVNMSCRRHLLGSLDSRMACGGQWHWELDACFQIRRAGKRLVFDPRICVDHFHGPRPGLPDPGFVYAANHNLVLNLARHFGLWRRLAFLAYTFLWGDYPEMGLAVFGKTYLGRLLRYRDTSFIRLLAPSLQGKRDALRVLANSRNRKIDVEAKQLAV